MVAAFFMHTALKGSIIRYLVSAFFMSALVYWGYQVLNPIELFEYRLVEQGMHWYAAPIVARLLIGFGWCFAFYVEYQPRE